MEEGLVKLVVYLFYGIFLGLKFLVLALIRLLRWALRSLQGQGQDDKRLADAASSRMPTASSRLAGAQATSLTISQRSPKSVAIERALDALIDRATAAAARCAVEEANERFADTLGRFIPAAARAAVERLRAGGDAALPALDRLVAQLDFLVEIVTDMAEQRRDPDKLLLLGDADALAEACYGPLVDFARGQGIRLRSERAATFLGDKDLAIFTGFIPSGLAPIILPSAWSTEIGWWPALAHEIGHDFHASVVGLDAELRRRFDLPANPSLPNAGHRLTRDDLGAAYSAWLAEVFADLFGTLMLGPAYVVTMSWTFAQPAHAQRVVVIQPTGSDAGWVGYEEHPPAHLRVVLGCRLLAAMGFPLEADRLEDEWRKRHESPGTFYLPTRQKTWIGVTEASFVDYGEELVTTLYQQGLTSLGGYALRSIPGLDLGPREHQSAIDAKDAFLAGKPAPTRDPRCLIAGAVLAWKDRPALAARILRAARATIASVGVNRRLLRLRAARDQGAAGPLTEQAMNLALVREAFVLGEVFAPPPASRIARRL